MEGKNMKIAAVAVVAVIVIAAAAVVIGGGVTESEKKGLYKLDAEFVEVSMGQCSATPSVILTLETVYEAYYGDYTDKEYTIDDVKADEAFWNEFCAWTPLVTDNGDGTFDVVSQTKAKGSETVTIPKVASMVTLGTMYSETLYFLLCEQYGVEPYSDAGLSNDSVGEAMKKHIAGGMQYSYYEQNEGVYMTAYIDESEYMDLGVTSVQKVDPEVLTKVLADAKADNGDVIYMASGTRINDDKYYQANTNPAKSTGTYYAFFAPQTFGDVCSCIDAIGKLMGFDDTVINGLIDDFQLRLYTVYKSVEENAESEKPKVYWESNTGKAVSSSMAKTIMEFLGFDTKLMDGAEHDMESLLSEKPSLLCFYTNDDRPMDEKMRTV